MKTEIEDMYKLLVATHESIDKMVADLSDPQWTQKPREDFNNVAAVLQHVTMVEERFLAILDGKEAAPSTVNPFAADHWDVPAIRAAFAAVPVHAREVLERLDPDTLEQHAVRLGIGELNRRQLLAYMIAHTTHHRGQIPLIKKLLPSA